MEVDCFDHYFAKAAEMNTGLGQYGNTDPNRRLSLPVSSLCSPAVRMHNNRVCSDFSQANVRRQSAGLTGLQKDCFLGSYGTVLEEEETQDCGSSKETEIKYSRRRSPRHKCGQQKRRSRSNSAPATDTTIGRRRSSQLAASGYVERKYRACSAPCEDMLLKKFKQLNLTSSPRRESYISRNFITSKKGGVFNKGDKLTCRTTSTSETETSDEGIERSRECSVVSDVSDSCIYAENVMYNVVLVGDQGVGKSAIARQFQTSEYLGSSDATFGMYLFLSYHGEANQCSDISMLFVGFSYKLIQLIGNVILITRQI